MRRCVGARQVRQRRIGCIPYPSTRAGSCRGGQRAMLRNGACLYERVQRATRGRYQSRDRGHGTVMMMRDQKGVRPSKTITERQRGTHNTEQGFLEELSPFPTLLRIPDIVRMEFELKQVICDTFRSSYVLIDPLPIIYVRIVLIVRALVPACRPRRITLRLRRMLAHLRFAGSFLAR
jgi:hypothetical protein